jgi:hypothetical protein
VKRTRLQRKKAFVARAKPRRRSKAGKAPSPSMIAARAEFKTVVCSEQCIGTGIRGHVCDGPLQAMHVVPKQTLRRRGLSHLRYDPANGVPGCYRIHRRHDNKTELIPRALLPERCIEWAAEHGVDDALDRHWPVAA